MFLSIVIPTHNRSLLLTRALQALYNGIGDSPDIEIHVVDDFSDFKHRNTNTSSCAQYGFHYHWLEKNRGPAHARNVGIQASKGKWVAFLDDDVCVDKKWFNSLKDAVSRADKATLGIEGITKSSGHSLWDSEVENLYGGLFLSCNIVYRREILTKCGGFDEQFSGPFAEDQELALRVKKWGNIVFNKGLVVHHMPRNIRLTTYLLESFSRMRMLLDAEFYFYMKHKDRYHAFRYADTFWEELLLILTKHSISTVRRRTLKQILFHPIQTAFLIISSLIEQLAAWIYVPVYLFHFFPDKSDLQDIHKGWEKTKKLWMIDNRVSPSIMQFNPNVLKSIYFRIKKTPVYNANEILKKTGIKSSSYSTRLFIRVDDMFLDNHELVNQFCDCIKQSGAPFLAAVTGQDLTKKENYGLIKNIVNAGGAIALHGFNHSGKYGPYPSEILQLSFPEIDHLTATVLQTNFPGEYKPIAFIPPFNAISWEQVVYLSNKFPIVCGGPESIRFTKYLFGPVFLNTGGLFFPSCYPFYDCSANILHYRITKEIIKSKAPVCVTVHFAAEASDSFASFTKLLNNFKTIMTDWNMLIRSDNKNHTKPAKALNQ